MASGQQRTTPDSVYMRAMGRRIKAALLEESKHRTAEAARKGIRRKDDIWSVLTEIYDKTGLTPRAVHAYMSGDRRPGMMDLRTLALETHTTMEELMQDIPYPVREPVR